MRNVPFRRLMALLLCFAMLMPNLTGLAASADATTEPGRNGTEAEKETPWVPVDPADIPTYTTSGSVSKELEMDCGNGLSQDGAQSHFIMVNGTNAQEHAAYLAVLAAAGFVKKAESTLAAKNGGNNLFSRWLSPKGEYVLTVYYTPDYSEVKIVADTAENMVKDFAAGFKYESTTGETAEVMMTMWGLSMSPNGYDITSKKYGYVTDARNCGALIVIRMPDNSLFINDGGDIQQWSDEACADFLEFCRSITGKSEGEKVVINTWFISHAHSDHFAGLPRFIDMFHAHIDIKNMMYNIDDERLGTTRDMSDVMKMVKAYYPDVKYYNPHTGDVFQIEGIDFQVLYAQEDRFLPAADGSLVVDKRDGDDDNENEQWDGTYRDFLYENPEKRMSDFNDTSTVLKITFPKTQTGASKDYTSILYGDANLADQVMMDTLAPSVLATDIMMVPHHGHDAHPELVAMSGAKIFLYTQAKSAIYGPDNDYTTEDKDGTFRPNLLENFLAMQDHGDENYFDTVANVRKTYWEGTETAVIFFGDNTAFPQAEKLGMMRDGDDPAGFSVYTKAAPFFTYEGWTVLSTAVGQNETTITDIPISTGHLRFDLVSLNSTAQTNKLAVGYSMANGNGYMIVHDQTDYALMYDNVAKTGKQTEPNLGTSMYIGSGNEASNGLADAYYNVLSGHPDTEKNKKNIYFTRDKRDAVMWIFNQYAKDVNVPVDQLKTMNGYFDDETDNTMRYVEFAKGLNTDAPYWYAEEGDIRWQYVRPSQDPVFTDEAGNHNAWIEFLDDGTCLIYYRGTVNVDKSDSAEEYVLRFLTVDASGNWIQKEYYADTSYADVQTIAKKDLAQLKLRLYTYNDTSRAESKHKRISFTGPLDFYTLVGTKKADLVNSIAYEMNVFDPVARNLPIPCSGTKAKAGCFWLDGDFTTSAEKLSVIKVWYRNDDGTDQLITELNLHVTDQYMMDAELVQEGMAAANSGITGNVYESRDDEGVVTDRTMTVIMKTEDGYVRQEVSVNVGMLTYNAGSQVNGSAVTGDVGGHVDTDVEAGTVYTGLTLSYRGMTITDNFTLRVEDISALDKPAYPNTGSVEVNKTGTAAGSSFFQTGVADINLSATGISAVSGVDMIIMLDMSGSMTQSVSSENATSRLAALKSSLESLINTLQDSEVDFRVAIADFGDLDHFMFDDAVADDSIREHPFFDSSNGTDWNEGAYNAYGTAYEFYNHLNFVFKGYGADIYEYTAGSEVRQWTISDFNTYLDTFANAYSDQWTKSSAVNSDGTYTYTNTTTQEIMALTENGFSDFIAAYKQAEKNRWTRGKYVVDFDNRAQPFDQTITKWNSIHPMYTGSLEPSIYTGSNKADADAFVAVNDESINWKELIGGLHQGDGFWYGTNYDRGLEYVYQLAYAAQQENIATGQQREVVAVFMSDGAPMQYNYFSGRTNTPAWSDWFSGRIDADQFQTSRFRADNLPATVTTLCNEILEKLKNGNLADPDRYVVKNSDTDDRVVAYTEPNGGGQTLDGAASIYNYVWGDASGNKRPTYINLDTSRKDEWHYFYTAMQHNDILLDKELLYRIAEENGIENFSNTPEQDAILLQLAKNNQLKYPTTNRYYPKYEGESTDLFVAFKDATGKELTWEKLCQIAYLYNSHKEDLRDIMAEITTMGDGMNWATLSPYSYFYNEEGKNWWAEAIKGDTDKLYPVVNKYAKRPNAAQPYSYYGTVRNHFDSGNNTAYDGQDYIAGFRGLGVPIYTLGLSIGGEGYLSNDDTTQVLNRISSGASYAYMAYSEKQLNDCFAAITDSVSHAASEAWFTDTLGEEYDLLTKTVNGVTPCIQVLQYELDENHNRTGTSTVLEEITFGYDAQTDKLTAWSSQIFTSDIVNDAPVIHQVDILGADGIIRGKYVYYNTNTVGTNKNLDNSASGDDIVDGKFKLDLTSDGVGDYWLDPETFLWIVGNIGADEMVLNYQVVLNGVDDDNPDNDPEGGVYPTNISAPLHYVNYRGKDMVQDTVSPEFPWKVARVGYGFYLVDEDGKPIVNMFTGATGSIENAVKMTTPSYMNMSWDTMYKISSFEKSAEVPQGYLLYTTNVDYSISVGASGAGVWDFSNDTSGTTYVQYGNTYTGQTNSNSLNLINGEIHNTIVWFAVKQALPLTVDKTVEKDGNDYKLTLEAFANASTSQITEVEPADIVLVLDQSSSMYTPLGWNKDRVDLEGGDTNETVNTALSNYAITDFVEQASTPGSEVQENAKRLGYYIAVHKSGSYMYLVHYAQVNGQWGWYYISLDQTTRSIDMDVINAQYQNPSTSSDLAGADYKAITSSAGPVLFNHNQVVYYKTQYGALVESVENFVSGLRQSGVAHRVGLVGFASPCYDGWKHYDGTGLYVNGNFYLYDTDFMYKGSYNGSTLVSGMKTNGVDFVEEDWIGDVVLDPNKTFASGNSAAVALDSKIVQHAYANSIIVKDSNGTPTGETMYTQALANVADKAAYDGLLKSIDAISANYQQTCPSVGIEIAEQIFAFRSEETSDRDKIVVLFTDGVPTVRLLSNRHHGFSNDVFAKALYWSVSGGVEDALDRAVIAKDNGVEIYTIGTAAMQSTNIVGTNINSGDFLNYLSSNYAGVEYGDPVQNFEDIPKDNKVYDGFIMNNMFDGEGKDKDPDHSHVPGSHRDRQYAYYDWPKDYNAANDELTYFYSVRPLTAASKQDYAQFAVGSSSQRSNDLNVAFGTIMSSITKPSVNLDENDILRDVLSEYFDLLAGENTEVKIYTAAMQADGTFAEPVVLAGGKFSFAESVAGSGRLDIINVTGYDYSEEYVSSTPRSKTVKNADGSETVIENYYGSKLIVEIPVKVRDGFWGGNNVPTNKDGTAIYDVTYGSTGIIGEETVVTFPLPQVNVPSAEIQANDVTVYYGDSALSHEDLMGVVTVGGKPVTIVDGQFVPSADWMDDYASVGWGDNSANLTKPVNSKAPAAYTYAVSFVPYDNGAKKSGSGYSNIVGDAISQTGITLEAVGHAFILVPTVTFKDGFIDSFSTVDEEFYQSNNRVDGVQWTLLLDGQNTTADTVYPAVSGVEPVLSYTYVADGDFRKNTGVNVTVISSNGNENITSVTTFEWVDCELDHEIATHLGSVDAYEFVIHVLTVGDSIVIDFGLAVDIHVLANDGFLRDGGAKVVGIFEEIPASVPGTIPVQAESVEGSMTVAADGGSLRYVLNTQNSMQMNAVDTFYYLVSYKGGYYYGQVDVIPATIVYYEDNFLSLEVVGSDASAGWTPVFTDPAVKDFSDVVQSEDRVGSGNIYGSDEAYNNSFMYSMGAAQHITVNPNRTGRAQFQFWGTGFDVISLTSSDTGTILVRVYQLDEKGQMVDNQPSDADMDPYMAYFVNTYYGYTYNTQTQKWEVRDGASDSLYQVPVINSELPYGHYKVELSISYTHLFDLKDPDAANGSYDFYLDAIRIYNPAGKDPVDDQIKDAYVTDQEYRPVFQELRDLLISTDDFNGADDVVDGIVFIDGIPTLSANQNSGVVGSTNKTPAIADYMNYGPNNELYLAKGQAVAFTLNKSDADQVHIAMKSVGGTAKVKIYAATPNVDVAAVPEITISTATDLYRNISEFKNGSTVVIYNSGDEADDAILSVTNIKTTYAGSGSGEEGQTFTIRREDLTVVLGSLASKVQTPVLKPAYPSLDFDEMIRYNVYFTVENGGSIAEMGLLSWYNNPDVISIDTAEYVTSGYTQNSEGAYMVHTQGIPAKNMSDTLYMAVYAKLSDGTYAYSDICAYHAKYYAEEILAASDSEEMKALCVAMLNYGAAAQVQFNHKADQLMNAGLTQAQKALVEEYNASMIAPVGTVDSDKVSNFAPVAGGFSNAYPSVAFDGAFAINYYFMPSAEVTELTFYAWSKDAYENVDQLTSDNATVVSSVTGENGTFRAAYTGIAARQMDETVYVCAVYELDGVRYCTGVIPYSISAYCADRIEYSTGNMQELVKLTAVYGFYAKSYFTSL